MGAAMSCIDDTISRQMCCSLAFSNLSALLPQFPLLDYRSRAVDLSVEVEPFTL